MVGTSQLLQDATRWRYMLFRVTNFCSDELHERVLSGHERRPIVATFLLFRLMLQRFMQVMMIPQLAAMLLQ